MSLIVSDASEPTAAGASVARLNSAASYLMLLEPLPSTARLDVVPRKVLQRDEPSGWSRKLRRRTPPVLATVVIHPRFRSGVRVPADLAGGHGKPRGRDPGRGRGRVAAASGTRKAAGAAEARHAGRTRSAIAACTGASRAGASAPGSTGTQGGRSEAGRPSTTRAARSCPAAAGGAAARRRTIRNASGGEQAGQPRNRAEPGRPSDPTRRARPTCRTC